jgi:hypothetical protein
MLACQAYRCRSLAVAAVHKGPTLQFTFSTNIIVKASYPFGYGSFPTALWRSTYKSPIFFVSDLQVSLKLELKKYIISECRVCVISEVWMLIVFFSLIFFFKEFFENLQNTITYCT